MTNDKDAIKIVFGLIIFAFSLALAYFTASYFEKNIIFDYWSTLVIFAAVYVAVGIVIHRVFPVSLGFLFAADALIFHLLFENFGEVPNLAKTIIIGAVLAILYTFAWLELKDQATSSPPVVQ